MSSCEAAVEASAVYVVDGFGVGAVEELPFVVAVFVLQLQLLLHQLVALPQRCVLDTLNLPVRQQHFYWWSLKEAETTHFKIYSC